MDSDQAFESELLLLPTPRESRQVCATFATRYLEANPGDLRGLAALLGYANLDTVMIYTEPRLEDLAARLEQLDQGIAG